ncbi:rho guanine nucleotide exchange factor [Fimicolochytrium jonesii]|uniref:rho guanine nucleotide exchange factor n=1 Tax=Fimicolochytrium jonesii TaxID=1396493 RepID=UPI0022FF3E13|nr:rho guanine nucleotide exchange factor [Fimicolochytrium jonesii]KAI8822520.1 Dbl homology domain-containing protein [Fimicolochytrium jonesii]
MPTDSERTLSIGPGASHPSRGVSTASGLSSSPAGQHGDGGLGDASQLTTLRFARALYDFAANERDELMLEEEDIVQVLKIDEKGGWMFGLKNGVWGWFPTNFVQMLTDSEAVLEGLLEAAQIGKPISFAPGTPTTPSPHMNAALHDSKQGSEYGFFPPSTSSQHISLSLSQSPSTNSLGDDSSGGRQVPGTRNWAAKYKAMPRYSKRVSGTGLDELETAIESGIKEALARPKSEITNVPEEAINVKEVASRKGSLRKKDLKFLGGSFAERSKTVTMVNQVHAIPRQRWVDVMGGAEEVAKLGLDKKEIQRQEVIHEIAVTEKDYVADLEIIINVYMNPMKKKLLLPAKDMAIIYSNVEQLLPVNQKLLQYLDERLAQGPVVEQVGDIFIRVSDFLKMYTMYCRNHPYALMKYQAVRQNKSVAKFMDNAVSESRMMSLADFL